MLITKHKNANPTHQAKDIAISTQKIYGNDQFLGGVSDGVGLDEHESGVLKRLLGALAHGQLHLRERQHDKNKAEKDVKHVHDQEGAQATRVEDKRCEARHLVLLLGDEGEAHHTTDSHSGVPEEESDENVMLHAQRGKQRQAEIEASRD
jgi:hypothetical protein